MSRAALAAAALALALASPARAETELTVEQAVSLAIERNPLGGSQRLSETVARIAASRAELDRFSATVGVDGGTDASRTKPWGEPGYPTTDASWGARASVAVPLTTGGRIDAAIDAARAAADSAAIDVALTERDLARAAYTAYWTIKGFERQIVYTEEGLVATQQARQIIESKAEVGLSAGVDVNRSTVDLLSQQETLIAQRAAMRAAEIELARLLHMVGETLVLVSDPPAVRTEPLALPAEPLSGRPEVRQWALSLAQADARVRIARAGALPTISLAASAGLGALASGGGPPLDLGTLATGLPADLFAPTPIEAADLARPSLDATIGLRLSWTPFDLLRTRQAVRQAKLDLARVAELNASEQDRLLSEVHNAAVQLEALRDRYPIVAERLELARDNQTIVQDLYAQGSATILDLFNAQSSFRAAAIQEANLTVDLATAELDLVWLLGGEPSGAAP